MAAPMPDDTTCDLLTRHETERNRDAGLSQAMRGVGVLARRASPARRSGSTWLGELLSRRLPRGRPAPATAAGWRTFVVLADGTNLVTRRDTANLLREVFSSVNERLRRARLHHPATAEGSRERQARRRRGGDGQPRAERSRHWDTYRGGSSLHRSRNAILTIRSRCQMTSVEYAAGVS